MSNSLHPDLVGDLKPNGGENKAAGAPRPFTLAPQATGSARLPEPQISNLSPVARALSSSSLASSRGQKIIAVVCMRPLVLSLTRYCF
jgi:hypothetical protein